MSIAPILYTQSSVHTKDNLLVFVSQAPHSTVQCNVLTLTLTHTHCPKHAAIQICTCTTNHTRCNYLCTYITLTILQLVELAIEWSGCWAMYMSGRWEVYVHEWPLRSVCTWVALRSVCTWVAVEKCMYMSGRWEVYVHEWPLRSVCTWVAVEKCMYMSGLEKCTWMVVIVSNPPNVWFLSNKWWPYKSKYVIKWT